MKKERREAWRMQLKTPLGTPIDLAAPVSADPLGSYTGVPEDSTQIPVQDADDL